MPAPVVVAFVVLASSLGLLAVIGWRVFRRVVSLGRAVGAAAERIAAASAGLDAVAPPRDDV